MTDALNKSLDEVIKERKKEEKAKKDGVKKPTRKNGIKKTNRKTDNGARKPKVLLIRITTKIFIRMPRKGQLDAQYNIFP